VVAGLGIALDDNNGTGEWADQPAKLPLPQDRKLEKAVGMEIVY
jgi:hypothetical protein